MKRRITSWVWLLAVAPGPAQVALPPEPPPVPVTYRHVPPAPPAESGVVPAAATAPAAPKPPSLVGSTDVKQGVEHLRSEREALARDRKDALEELLREETGPAERAALRRQI